MSWKGPMGPKAELNCEYLVNLIENAAKTFGVKKENILVGYCRIPPEDKNCQVYIYFSGCSTELYIRKDGSWVNNNYACSKTTESVKDWNIGLQGVPGPAFGIIQTKGLSRWTEECWELQNLCMRVRNYINGHIDLVDFVKISSESILFIKGDPK